MAAIAFDPLEFTHELEASGVPREQAEVHAKAMTAMFLHNVEALVTTDYLDTRFTEFETRVVALLDRRLFKVDSRLDSLSSSVDARFDSLEIRLDSKIDMLAGAMDVRFERIDSRISRIYLMFGLTMVTATIPILQNLFAG